MSRVEEVVGPVRAPVAAPPAAPAASRGDGDDVAGSFHATAAAQDDKGDEEDADQAAGDSSDLDGGQAVGSGVMGRGDGTVRGGA
ncbi:hypothetical protein FZEAL_4494 [Fusarium zealandicum]|uniref:Uncharacterized protein n=1 Tax=Fusarium zealandicum TaxID=1053134 RepID=A0A8H4XLU3_9HYPO|nr:hypothetical protein FZEAL_4494 [Fusarium zealandicum]